MHVSRNVRPWAPKLVDARHEALDLGLRFTCFLVEVCIVQLSFVGLEIFPCHARKITSHIHFLQMNFSHLQATSSGNFTRRGLLAVLFLGSCVAFPFGVAGSYFPAFGQKHEKSITIWYKGKNFDSIWSTQIQKRLVDMNPHLINCCPPQSPLLWMDEILHHLRIPGMTVPL